MWCRRSRRWWRSTIQVNSPPHVPCVLSIEKTRAKRGRPRGAGSEAVSGTRASPATSTSETNTIIVHRDHHASCTSIADNQQLFFFCRRHLHHNQLCNRRQPPMPSLSNDPKQGQQHELANAANAGDLLPADSPRSSVTHLHPDDENHLINAGSPHGSEQCPGHVYGQDDPPARIAVRQ